MSTEISNLIKDNRIKKGLSQRMLAEKAGISNTEIWRIEKGERKQPTPYILKAISPHIGIPYEMLMIKAGYIEDKSTLSYDVIIDNEFIKILNKVKQTHRNNSAWANTAYRVLKELPPDDFAALKKITDALLKKNELQSNLKEHI